MRSCETTPVTGPEFVDWCDSMRQLHGDVSACRQYNMPGGTLYRFALAVDVNITLAVHFLAVLFELGGR